MSTKLYSMLALLFLLSIALQLFFAISDPDPIMDFCIPIHTNHTKHMIITSTVCKNSSEATVDDFVFSGIKSPGDFEHTGFSSLAVNPSLFPALNTLGMSFVRADIAAGGINVPHYHPRATEVAFVLEGTIYSGFVDSGNRIFAKLVEKGEVMVFPKGLVHFQMNVGRSPATILGSFNSQNPGLVKLPMAMFGSGIDEELVRKAFGLSEKEVERLRRKFGPSANDG